VKGNPISEFEIRSILATKNYVLIKVYTEQKRRFVSYVCDNSYFLEMKHVGGKKRLLYIQKLDKLKDAKVFENKNDISYFVRFSYKELPLTEELVKRKLEKHGVKVLYMN
jgi:hypothetical protein